MSEAGYSITVITLFALLNSIACFIGAYLISSTRWYPPSVKTEGNKRSNKWSHWAYIHIGMFMFILGIVNACRFVLCLVDIPPNNSIVIAIRLVRDIFATGLYGAIGVFIATLYKGVLKNAYWHHLECKLKGIPPEDE
jgi:H+/Cl- antiporter ClcA